MARFLEQGTTRRIVGFRNRVQRRALHETLSGIQHPTGCTRLRFFFQGRRRNKQVMSLEHIALDFRVGGPVPVVLDSRAATNEQHY